MAALCLRRLLVLLASVCAATAVPVVPAAAETEGALSLPADFGLDQGLLQQTGEALASQHSELMADTDVFGLYRPHPGPGPTPAQMGGLSSGSAGPAASQAVAPASVIGNGMPALFPDPFAAFSGPVVPAVGSAADPVPQLSPVQRREEDSNDVTMDAAEEADQPAEQASIERAEPEEEPARETAYATAPETLSVRSEALAAGPEQLSAGPKMLSAGPERLSAGPEMSAGPEAQTARLQEAVDAAGTVVSARHKTPPRRHAQPQPLPNPHILCLLPEPGRHRAAPAAKDEHAAGAPTPGAAESGDKHAVGPVLPGAGGTETGETAAGMPGRSGTHPGSAAVAGGTGDAPLLPSLFPGQPPTDQQTPFLYTHQIGQTFSPSQQPAPGDDSAAFDQLWNQFGAETVAAGPDGQQVFLEPYPDQAMFPSSEPGASSDTLPDSSTFGLPPDKPLSADGTKQGPQELLRSPTYFASYPRQSQYPQRSSGYYPAASRSPVASNAWGRPAGGWGAGSPWSYAARSAPTQVSRRTAYPAPWAGQGRGPTGAGGWPWPALSTESRGQPRAVPSSGVYLVQQSGGRPAVGGYPLYSQWYRPAVVPLPGGGGGGGGGWWTPDGRFVRPATAMATSEESGVDSPPLGGDWSWPAVSMLGGRDALVVTGMGRSSGAMARAAGQHGWPPVAMATAGNSPSRGSFSRASSGGFDLIFEDGMFATGPMALKKSPDEYVPPQKRPKKPSTAAETEDGLLEAGTTEAEAEEDAAPPAGEGGTAEEEIEGSGADEQ